MCYSLLLLLCEKDTFCIGDTRACYKIVCHLNYADRNYILTNSNISLDLTLLIYIAVAYWAESLLRRCIGKWKVFYINSTAILEPFGFTNTGLQAPMLSPYTHFIGSQLPMPILRLSGAHIGFIRCLYRYFKP